MPEPAETAAAAADVAAAPPRSGGAIVRAGVLSMLALVALGLTRLVHGSLISHATDNQTYALVGTLIATATTAGLFLPGGLASAASKFIPYQLARANPDGAQAVYRLLRRFGYASGVLLGLVVAAGVGPLIHANAAEALAGGLLTAVFAVYSVEKSALYGFARVPVYVRLELAGSGFAVISTVFMLAIGSRAYLVPLMLGYAILATGAWWTLRTHHGWRWRAPAWPRSWTWPRSWDWSRLAPGVPAEDLREIAGYVVLASIGGLAGFGFLQLLPLLAHGVTTEVEISFFVAAVNLVAPLYFLPRALSLALFPALAHAHGSGDLDAVRSHTDVSTRALLVLLAPVFAVGLLIAPELTTMFGGARYLAGAAALQVLTVATYFAVVQVAAVNSLSSGTRREVRIPVYSTVAGCLVGLALVVPLGRAFGASGVGAAYLAALTLGAAGPIAAVWRRYQMAWTATVVRSLAVVFGAWGISAGLREWVGQRPGRVLIDLSAAVVVGLVALAVLRSDIRHIVRFARPHRPSEPDPVGTLVP